MENLQSNVENNEIELPEQFQAFYKHFSEELDKKFSIIENDLNETKNDIILLTKSKLDEVEALGKDLNTMESVVFGENSTKKSDDMIKYKKLAELYMSKCEGLDILMATVKDTPLDKFIRFNKKGGFSIEHRSNELFKEIPKLKGEKVTEIKWKPQQKKHCTIRRDGFEMEVNYNSCWNDFHSEPIREGEVEIFLEVDNFTANSNYAIGITNQNYNGTTYCIGCQSSPNAYVMKKNNLYYGSQMASQTLFTIPDNGKFYLKITLDCDKKLVTFTSKEGKSVGPTPISGNEWKVTVGQCTSGRSIYRFIDDFNK